MAAVRTEKLPVETSRGRRPRPPGGARVGRRARLQPGRSDQDRHRRQRAGAQHARSTAAAARASSRACTTATRRGLRLTFEDQGPGHRRHRAGAARRLHHRQRARPRPGRRDAAVQRVRHPLAAGRGHARARSRAGNDVSRPSSTWREAQPRRRRAARGGRRSRRRLGFDEATRGRAGARRHRAGDQPGQARAAAASRAAAARACRPAAASRCSRSTAARAWPTSRRCLRGWLLDGGQPGHRARRDAPPVAAGSTCTRGPGAARRCCASSSRRAAARRPTAAVRSAASRCRSRARPSAATPGRCSSDAGDCTVLVVDGLGHGPDAARGRREAVRDLPPERPARCRPRACEALHAALRATRGAAVAVARHRLRARKLVRFAGVGNIAGVARTASEPVRHLVSHNGIAGHERAADRRSSRTRGRATAARDALRRPRHAAGRSTAYPGLLERHPGARRRRAVPRSSRAAATMPPWSWPADGAR